MNALYPIDYRNLYGMTYRIYLNRKQLKKIFPDVDNQEYEDAWYNCIHDKLRGIRRETRRDLMSDEETFVIMDGDRMILNPKYDPPNKNCKRCRP